MDVVADAELVARSRARDAAAFGVLVARHRGLVRGVALAKCGDPALADDVTQDSFIAAWRSLDNLRDADAVGPWVAGIAKNLAAAALRSRARTGIAVDPEDAIEVVPSPEEAAIEHEDRALLLRSLADVPDAFRDVLVRYYLDGDSITDIARALDVREDLVKQRLSRGRKALRELVAARVDSALVNARRKRLGAFAAAGKALAAMTGKQITIGIVVALVVGAGVWLVAHRGGEQAPAASAASGSGAAPAPAVAHVAQDAATPSPKPRVQRLADKSQRTQMLDAIRQQRAARAAGGGSSAGTPAPALPEAKMDKAYIRASVREMLPLLTECYENALEKDPKLAGDVTVDFTIEGEPGVGGVIGESTINADKTTIADPGMRECIQETMYGIEIDPPEGGGVVHVTYPFAFSPGPPQP